MIDLSRYNGVWIATFMASLNRERSEYLFRLDFSRAVYRDIRMDFLDLESVMYFPLEPDKEERCLSEARRISDAHDTSYLLPILFTRILPVNPGIVGTVISMDVDRSTIYMRVRKITGEYPIG